jgi:GR25 family glycosyltransferase involved in LPS biosynthesis
MQSHTQVLNVTGDPELVRCLWEKRLSLTRRGELGVTLSHLKAVRTAYLNGDDMALIIEDDMNLALRPYWTFDVNDLIATLRQQNVSWHSVQLQYIFREPHRIDDRYIWEIKEAEMLDGRLYKTWFQWCTGAYLVSRAGMHEVVRHFLRNSTSGELMLNPVCDGCSAIDNDIYYPSIFKDNYISLPPLFVVDKDQPSERDESHAWMHNAWIDDRIDDLTAYSIWNFVKQQRRPTVP